MKRIQFHLEGGLSEKDLRHIHSQVLRVLDEIGVECASPRVLEILAAKEGIKIDGPRVRFAPHVVDAAIECAREQGRNALPPPAEISVTGPWNCFNIEDMDTGRVRQSTAEDVRHMFKLLHVAKAGGVSPVYPTDIHAGLQMLYLEKTGIETSTTDGSRMEFADRRMLEFAIEMYKAAGRKYTMVVEFPISPLRMNPSGLETILDYMDRSDVTLEPAPAPIPLAGCTAPLFEPGAIVQSVAETLAACIILDMISNGALVGVPHFRVDLFDMRHMTTVFASPDHILHQLIVRDVARYFSGKPFVDHYWCCNAKRSGHQAMLERTSWILTLAFAGFRRFWYGAGQLSMDEVFSPAQFVIDLEIARYVNHLIRGIDYYDEPDLSFDTIASVGPRGDFLTHATTLEGMSKLFDSDLFPRNSVEQWRALGEPDPWRMAAEKAKAMIASHNYAIEAGVQEELNRIYAQAQAYVTSQE
jgi:trimethylamine--corrinoid protein Co-methyltransferase